MPISRLAECLTATQRDIAESKLLAPIVGHVGDGNFHVGLLVDMNDEEEVTRVRAFLERLTERALAMDGTCTGEHGIGQGKMKYLPAEHGAAGARRHARDQAGTRPARHYESRQDFQSLSFADCYLLLRGNAVEGDYIMRAIVVVCLLAVLSLISKTAHADDWNFTPTDYQNLTNGGGDLSFASDADWLPQELKDNLMQKLSSTS